MLGVGQGVERQVRVDEGYQEILGVTDWSLFTPSHADQVIPQLLEDRIETPRMYDMTRGFGYSVIYSRFKPLDVITGPTKKSFSQCCHSWVLQPS